MRYVFEDCELDLQSYEFRRAGVPLALGPKIFDMLLFLIRHRHRVVHKEELLEHLWPAQFVSDASLMRCMSSVRQVVHPHGHAKDIIKTFYGRGYRFIAPVEEYGTHHMPNTRHQVTVLCAELAEAQVLAEGMPAETFEALLHSLFALAAGTVRQYEGHIRHFTDSGLVALFGVPRLHNNHASRALCAAVALQRRLRETRFSALPTATAMLQFGLHSGEVIGRHIHAERRLTYIALGNTFRMATSMQRLAAPDHIILSETTASIIDGIADLLVCAATPLTGQAQTVYTLGKLHTSLVPNDVMLHAG